AAVKAEGRNQRNGVVVDLVIVNVAPEVVEVLSKPASIRLASTVPEITSGEEGATCGLRVGIGATGIPATEGIRRGRAPERLSGRSQECGIGGSMEDEAPRAVQTGEKGSHHVQDHWFVLAGRGRTPVHIYGGPGLVGPAGRQRPRGPDSTGPGRVG